MRVIVFVFVSLLIGSGCARAYVSPARFASRAPTGGVIATPSADTGMSDAHHMIAAHCGAGGYRINREGEAVVGSTVVVEGASTSDVTGDQGEAGTRKAVNARTTAGARSRWEIHYDCVDPSTATMGLVTANVAAQPAQGFHLAFFLGGGTQGIRKDRSSGSFTNGSAVKMDAAMGGRFEIGMDVIPRLTLNAQLDLVAADDEVIGSPALAVQYELLKKLRFGFGVGYWEQTRNDGYYNDKGIVFTPTLKYAVASFVDAFEFTLAAVPTFVLSESELITSAQLMIGITL